MILNFDYVFILPSLKTAGGNLEVIRLADDVRRQGKTVAVVSMWQRPNPIATDGVPTITLYDRPVNIFLAFLSIPLIAARFIKMVRHSKASHTKFVFTHFATYLLHIFTPKSQRWFFTQALEWYFVKARALQSALKLFILSANRSGHVLTANPFLTRSLEGEGITVAATADIWADPFFADGTDELRIYDVALMFRKGTPKRADWGIALLEALRIIRPDLRIVAVSPDEEFADHISADIDFLLRPEKSVLRQTYHRSRVFVLFSDHEGFGLPPLEAMGCGCVPLCRDSGGVRAYMEPLLEENIVPLRMTPDDFARHLSDLVDDPKRWISLSETSRRVFNDGLHRAASRVSALEQCGFIAKRANS